MPIRPPSPNWFTKVNFIVGWYLQGCEVPLQLYVQFAREPTLDVAIVLGTLNVKDLFKEFFRPKGLRTGRHGRKGNRGKKALFNLVDVDELVGHTLADGVEFRGRPFGSPTFWLFEISDVVDRISWTFFCIDGLTNIGFETMLGIIEADTSRCPQISRMLRHTNYQAILPTHYAFAGYPIDILDWDVGINTPNGLVADLLADKRYAITHEMRGKQILPGTCEIAIGIYDYLAGKNVNETGFVTNNYPDSLTLSVDAIVTGPGTVGCSIANGTPGHPGPGGQHWQVDSAKWLILELT